jgi:hypothetical protein
VVEEVSGGVTAITMGMVDYGEKVVGNARGGSSSWYDWQWE